MSFDQIQGRLDRLKTRRWDLHKTGEPADMPAVPQSGMFQAPWPSPSRFLGGQEVPTPRPQTVPRIDPVRSTHTMSTGLKWVADASTFGFLKLHGFHNLGSARNLRPRLTSRTQNGPPGLAFISSPRPPTAWVCSQSGLPLGKACDTQACACLASAIPGPGPAFAHPANSSCKRVRSLAQASVAADNKG